MEPEAGQISVDSIAAVFAAAHHAMAQHNVRFEHGDAQVHSFRSQHYDVAISRYGTMFFADPIAAFRNIGSALRLDGRLVMMVVASARSE